MSDYITFDLNSFKQCIGLLSEVSLISIYVSNCLTEIRGHYSGDTSNILSILLKDNNIFEVFSNSETDSFKSVFTITKSVLDLLVFLDYGTITFYVSEDYIKISINSKIKVIITTDNLYTDEFLDIHLEENKNNNMYKIDKSILQGIYSILTHKEKTKLYFKVDNSTLSLQSGNTLEFILLENINSGSFKYKINFDTFLGFINKTNKNNLCFTNSYNIILEKDKPLIIYISGVICEFYIFMAPFER